MRRVFETQELVTAICVQLHAEYELELLGANGSSSYDRDQFQRTALVSTRFFRGMLPHLWERVRVVLLFRRGLIPSKIIRGPKGGAMHISDSISRETMSRFHFYAPYIKTLLVPSPHMMIETHNWEPLVAYSKDNELFPNLVEFFCAEFHPQALSAFLPRDSTCKVTIESPCYPKHLDMADTKKNLEHIALQCPGLYSLEFHPESDTTTDDLMLMHVLSSFKNLGHLVSTPTILHSAALQVVAQLPCLHTLSIDSYFSGYWDSSSCEQVPVGGFPALSNLMLRLRNSQDAKQFWEFIPLGMLKKLVLTIEDPDDEFEFISTLCRTSPQITDLVIKFGKFEKYRRQVYKMSADVFEHLARLPIESCSFKKTELEFEGAWVRVAGAWQNAKSIEFLHQPTSLEDLFVLSSSLPHLKSIGCKFDLAHAAFTVGPNWSPVGQPPFYSGSLNLTSSQAHLMKIAYGPELTGLARYFAYFWPKLSIKSVE
ncbi:hypothetical protein FRC08_018423, partial [Ceratobasidium sp. 394]